MPKGRVLATLEPGAGISCSGGLLPAQAGAWPLKGYFMDWQQESTFL